MESAKFDRKTISIISEDGNNIFKTSGSVIKFDGYLKLSKIDEENEDEEILPDVKKKMLILVNLLMNNILHNHLQDIQKQV